MVLSIRSVAMSGVGDDEDDRGERDGLIHPGDHEVRDESVSSAST